MCGWDVSTAALGSGPREAPPVGRNVTGVPLPASSSWGAATPAQRSPPAAPKSPSVQASANARETLVPVIDRSGLAVAIGDGIEAGDEVAEQPETRGIARSVNHTFHGRATCTGPVCAYRMIERGIARTPANEPDRRGSSSISTRSYPA